MTTYMFLSDFIKKNYPKEIINQLLAEILEVTLPAKSDYPDYERWFLETFIPGLWDGSRDIVLAIRKGEIIGVANLKNNSEKKICTLYIKPKYQKKKEGLLLVEKSFEFLGTTKPLITMPITKVKDFYSLIRKYHWELSDEIDDCYKKNTQELIFNSSVEPISVTDSMTEVLEKIITKKRNHNIMKFKLRISEKKSFIKSLINSYCVYNIKNIK